MSRDTNVQDIFGHDPAGSNYSLLIEESLFLTNIFLFGPICLCLNKADAKLQAHCLDKSRHSGLGSEKVRKAEREKERTVTRATTALAFQAPRSIFPWVRTVFSELINILTPWHILLPDLNYICNSTQWDSEHISLSVMAFQ